MKPKWRLALLGASLVLAVGGLFRASFSGKPLPQALQALSSGVDVAVTTEPWLTFHPTGDGTEVGLIFYPGGFVDPRVYAPAAREIAANGYLVVVVPMPLQLAVIAPNRAEQIIQAHPEISSWAIGGHSLGGAMAARFAHRHPKMVEGLVLWGAYPPANDDLSDRALAVTAIYGTNDGLVTVEDILASRSRLPASTIWVPIEGGNHAQFAWYKDQFGDREAGISRKTQQAQTTAATLILLSQLVAGKD